MSWKSSFPGEIKSPSRSKYLNKSCYYMNLDLWQGQAVNLGINQKSQHCTIYTNKQSKVNFQILEASKRTYQTTSITANCVIQKWKWQHEPFFLFWSNNPLFLASDESQSTKPHRETQKTISDVNFWNVNSWLEAECPRVGGAATLRASGLRQWYKRDGEAEDKCGVEGYVFGTNEEEEQRALCKRIGLRQRWKEQPALS